MQYGSPVMHVTGDRAAGHGLATIGDDGKRRHTVAWPHRGRCADPVKSRPQRHLFSRQSRELRRLRAQSHRE
jgi:hypothetical protein